MRTLTFEAGRCQVSRTVGWKPEVRRFKPGPATKGLAGQIG